MQLKNLLIGGSVGLAFFGLYLHSNISAHAATKTITILNSAFSDSLAIVNAGDTVVWQNNDTFGHRLDILNASDSSFLAGDDLSPKVSTSTSGRTLSRKFNTEGLFIYRLDQQASMSGTLTVVPSIVVPTVTPSATATATATAVPTATATVTPTLTPTASPTPSVTATASPTATPALSPTPSPSLTPSPTPTLTPTPTVTSTPSATPTVTITASPTVSPSATASPTPTPSMTASPTTSPTSSPTATPTSSITPSPTSTPVPPVGEVLPAFSVFRPTMCSALLITNNTQIRTDKLGAVTLRRGIWNVENLVNTPPNVSVQARLIAIRTVNLLFGNNPFFGLDRTVSANTASTFNAASVEGALQKAAQAWCK